MEVTAKLVKTLLFTSIILFLAALILPVGEYEKPHIWPALQEYREKKRNKTVIRIISRKAALQKDIQASKNVTITRLGIHPMMLRSTTKLARRRARRKKRLKRMIHKQRAIQKQQKLKAEQEKQIT